MDWGVDGNLTSYSKQLSLLPEVLRDSGYITALIAGNPLYYASGLFADGFDFSVDLPVPKGKAVNQAAASLLERVKDDQPLFLLAHYMDVHNWEADFKRMFPRLSVEKNHRDQLLRSYASAVQDASSALEDLLAVWSARRGLDNTMVIFFSDHGEQIFDPVLGHGNTMEDVLLHVPLLVKYPRGSVRSGIVHRNASLADVAPTVLDVVGIPYESSVFSGSSLLSVGEKTGPDDRVLFAGFQLYEQELSSARRGPFKMVVKPNGQQAEFSTWRPAATTDATPAGRAVAERALRTALAEYARSAKERRGGLNARTVDREKMLQTLKSLGYIRGPK
jgi:arylsulfatase A-like enzyme